MITRRSALRSLPRVCALRVSQHLTESPIGRHWPPRIDGGSAVPVEAEEQVDDQGNEAAMSAVVSSVAIPATLAVVTAVEGTAVPSGGGVGEADLDRLDDGRGDRHGMGNAGPEGRGPQRKGRQRCGQPEARR
jgi:hypothetical protein